jgi:WD40 repeat protein
VQFHHHITLNGAYTLGARVCWSPDERFIAVFDPGARYGIDPGSPLLRVIAVETGALQATHTGHHRYVEAAAWNPTRTTIASGGLDQNLHVWRAGTGELLHEQAISFWHSHWITALAWHPDGSLVASGDYGGRWCIHDISSRPFSLYWEEIRLTRKPVSALAFSPDGKLLAVASGRSGEAAVSLYDVAKRCHVFGWYMDEATTAMYWNPDCKTLLALGPYQSILCQVNYPETFPLGATRSRHAPTVPWSEASALWTRGGEHLYVTTDKGELKHYAYEEVHDIDDIDSSTRNWQEGLQSLRERERIPFREQWESTIGAPTSVITPAFSPSGWLVACVEHGAIHLWKLLPS